MKFWDIITITAIGGGLAIVGYLYFTGNLKFPSVSSGGEKEYPESYQYDDFEKEREKEIEKESSSKEKQRYKTLTALSTPEEIEAYERARIGAESKAEVNRSGPESELEWFLANGKKESPLEGAAKNLGDAWESTLEFFGFGPKGADYSAFRELEEKRQREIYDIFKLSQYRLSKEEEEEIVEKAQDEMTKATRNKIESECEKLHKYGLEPPKWIKPFC